LVLLCAAGPAHAQESGDRLSAKNVFAWPARASRLMGDWGGLRSRLEERGFRLSLFYNHYYARKGTGGLDLRRSSRSSGSVDLFGQFDLSRISVIPGGEVLVHVKSLWSESINPWVGALGDPIDDGDGNHPLSLYQLYYQRSTQGRTFQIRAGYFDQQTVLDRNAFANSEDRQFMNAYLDNNNAIIPLAVGAGAALFINPTDWLSFVVTTSDAEARPFRFSLDTAFDGDADYFAYFQTDLRLRFPSANGALDGSYRFGVFLDPRDRTVFGTDRIDTANPGFYLSVDQMVYRERGGGGLGLFSRYGWRPGEVNRVEHFVSAGAQYEGPLPRRPQDVLGFGHYSVLGSNQYRQWIDPDFDRETGYELYYSAQLFPAVTLSPAVQYIRQPGGLRSHGDAFVFALRTRFVF
jgi:porin